MRDLTIRAAEDGDVSRIQGLFDLVDAHHAAILPHVFRAVTRARPDSFIRSQIESPSADVLLALIESEIVGFLNLREECTPDYPMFRRRRFVFIDSMAVAEEHRGRGIGTALLRRAEHWATHRELDSIQLSVWMENTHAIRLYEWSGYCPVLQRMELKAGEAGRSTDGEP